MLLRSSQALDSFGVKNLIALLVLGSAPERLKRILPKFGGGLGAQVACPKK